MASDTPSSFTGRTRNRQTRKGVVLADKVARTLITVGGIGTILAVLGVMVFLISVVIPLFLPADIDNLATFDVAEAEVLHLGMDEYRLLGWILRPSGQIDVYRLDTGALRHSEQLFEPGQMVSSSFLIRGDLAIFGLADGTVQIADVGFETTISNGEGLAPEARQILQEDPEAIVDFEDGVVSLTPQGQYRIQRFATELGRSTRIGNGPVLEVSHAIGPNGPLIAAVVEQVAESVVEESAEGDVADPAIDPAIEPVAEEVADLAAEEGAEDAIEPGLGLFLIAGTERSNFLTGQTTLEFAAPVELPLESDEAPHRLALAGAGDSLYLVWKDGRLHRLDTGDVQNTFLAQRAQLLEPGRELRGFDFILGNNTLVWGDSYGEIRAGFPIRINEHEGELLAEHWADPRADSILVPAKVVSSGRGQGAMSLAPSARTRQLFAGFSDGHIEFYNVTSASRLAYFQLPVEEPVLEIVMAPKEDGVLALTQNHLFHADFDPRHPEASLSALFRPVWYEGYPSPSHTWQSSSGTDDFEVKLGLMPLIFGTLKATFYSMLFGVPLALLAALFTSEFLHPRAKNVIKPGIELMASLPSVVLGFLAALVFAPYIERVVPATLASFFTIPLTFLLGAFLWQLLPSATFNRLRNWRFLFMLLIAPLGLWFGSLAGPWAESVFFAGDLKSWLSWDGSAEGAEVFGSSVGGWMLLFFPLSGLFVAWATGRWGNNLILDRFRNLDRRQLAFVDLGKFALGLAATFGLALLLSYLVQSLGFDPRGVYVDTYVQRNAMIVGFVMGFAIIPIIYTISEDALATVPDHLRSASLGAGATPWQTATRIVIPTAMSGLFSAMMVGLGRAVGETMIVLMAAGNTPVMEMNIFEGFRTLSANIAVELPEAVRNSTHYRTLFLAALVLFVLTFVVNTIAEVIRQRFRKRAYQL